jgi:predicted ATPase
LEVAAGLLDDFSDGVFFVDLAPIRDPGLVASTISQTLGVRETEDRPLQESLQDYLRQKQFLLLLDNFEHVMEAAPLVAELLAAAPRLKVLVTSRAPLHLHGEQEFPVPPLAVPDLRSLPPVPALWQYGAVRLFVERARAVKPDFSLSNENAVAVAEICCRLDGLPLAIELAAARMKLFSPQALLSRLEHRLALLTGGARDLPKRQQTLRGAIAWSYDLLDESEQRLFRWLSCFVSGCTLAAVEAVCNAEGELDVLEGLASLVDKSLLRQEEQADGEPRFGMLEMIREFGLERLAKSGETETIRRKHAHFFLAMAEAAGPKLHSAERDEWLQRLERDYSNVQAALAWSQAGPESGDLGLRLAGALHQFWLWRGNWSEGRGWLEAALARSEPTERTRARAEALFGLARLAAWQGDSETARPPLEEAVALYREVGDKRGLAHSLTDLGFLELHLQNDPAAVRALQGESMTLAREVGDRECLASSLLCLGCLAMGQGALDEAQSLFEEALAISRETGNRSLVGWSLSGSHVESLQTASETRAIGPRQAGICGRPLGDRLPGVKIQRPTRLGRLVAAAISRGDHRAARAFAEESLAIHRQWGGKIDLAYSLRVLGDVACYQGDYSTARALYQESLAIQRELGDKHGSAGSLDALGVVARSQGDYSMARALSEESLTTFRGLGDKRAIASTLNHLAMVVRDQGEYEAARALNEESLAIFREMGDKRGIAQCLHGLAVVAGAQGQAARSTRLFAAAEAMCEAMAVQLSFGEREEYERDLAIARSVLGEQAFAAAWAKGRAQSLEETVAYALEESWADTVKQ